MYTVNRHMCYLNTRLRQPRCHCNADLFRNRFAFTKITRLIYKMYQCRHLAYMLDLQMSVNVNFCNCVQRLLYGYYFQQWLRNIE